MNSCHQCQHCQKKCDFFTVCTMTEGWTILTPQQLTMVNSCPVYQIKTPATIKKTRK